jgi:uncharacterized protein (TIGR02099 family)
LHVPATLISASRFPLLRRGLRILLIGLTLVYFGFAVVVLALRYAVLPQIENYRPTIERLLGDALNRPVSIRQVQAYWSGLRPALTLNGLDIRDQEGRSALGLEQVDAELAWDSLLFMELRLARLEIAAPDLVLRRDSTGRLFVAGLEITPQPDSEDGFADWLLEQHSVVVRDARLQWIDEMRGAPTLELKKLNLQLDNRFSRHRFGFTAEPPPALAARIDVRGDFKGRDIDVLEAWKGQLFAEFDYADLAVWQQWIDYPISLPQGQGGLRLWLEFAGQQPNSITTEFKLAEVKVKLRPDLPEMDLLRLDGRLTGKRRADGVEFQASRLALATRDGVEVPPTDLTFTWQDASAKQSAHGSLSANGLDLAALGKIASYLPLDPLFRERLAKHAPGGKIQDLALSWQGTPQALDAWAIKARFDALQLTALGPIPGLSGISGLIDGNEKGGRMTVNGAQASLMLPAIFPEPRLGFDQLNAELGWRPGPQGIEVNLQKLAFQNQDATGDASGRWYPSKEPPGGPGVIDLNARITRGNGDAVWRYIPLVVGQQTRTWLRGSLHGGTASDVSLRLQGDLSHFPFQASAAGKKNANGIFRIQGKFRDARLDYADSWPELSGIEGELLFDGARMLITGKQAKIAGVTVSNVQAEIKDLMLPEELLEVSGTAAGPTADFLRFIEASPVGERIDHFTAAMQAEGKGELEIKLALPLRRIEQGKIEGRYRFDNNRLRVDSDLPPLTEVRGQINFTGDSLESKGLRGQLIGAPLAIDIRTGKDGNVQVNTGGDISIANLRQQFPSSLFDHLAGTTKWSGTIRIQKQATEVAITSNLVGLTSSLPSPFNKTASDPLPLRFERKALPAPAAKVGADGTAPDQVDLTLGKLMRLQLARRHEGGKTSITRGSLALGNAAVQLPERGIQVVGNLPSVDADFWRDTFSTTENGNGTASETGNGWMAGLPPVQFSLRTDTLKLFDKNFHDIRVSGQRQGTLTRFELKSPELAGNFSWDTVGSGKLTGKLGQLAIPESVAQPEKLQSEVGTLVKQLPALDITIGKLSFKDRELGAANISAENRDDFWNARFKLDAEETQLKGTLEWRPDPKQSETRLAFDLNTKSIEKMLGRLGYVEGIRRGSADLNGQLTWHGAPVSIDYPTLTGNISADAASGQFTKLEPGVGRLLGVLSLQSLPRRITLDFRDIFSEGFAFDRIRGKFDVKHGVMHTTDLQIQGPAAKVLMNGSIDLAHETQNLKVRVQPAVGETLAVGAMIANPVAGAVAWMAQKLLKDPLDQAFAFEYAVTGQWRDPKVDKLATQMPEEKK